MSEATEIYRAALDERLAPYQRVRRLEFTEPPETICGTIRPIELRGQSA